MRPLSVKSTLLLLALAVLAVISVLAVQLVQYRADVSSAFRLVIDVHQALVLDLQEMYAQGLQTGQATRNIMLNPGDRKAKENYDQAHAEFLKANDHALAISNAEAKARLEAIRQLWMKDHDHKLEAQRLAAQVGLPQATEFLNKQETPLWREVKKLLQPLMEEQKKDAAAEVDNLKAREARMFGTIAVIIAVSLAVLAGLLWFVLRSITRPLKDIRCYSGGIEKGDFSACMLTRHAPEFQEVIDSLGGMVRSLENSLGFYKGIVSGIKAPFVVTDDSENLALTNDSMLAILEVEGRAEDHYGHNVAQFFYGDASRRTVLADAMQQKKSITKEVELTSRKGSKRNIVIHASPLYNAINHDLMGALCVYTDVTAERQAARTITEQGERLLTAADRADSVATAVVGGAKDLSERIKEARQGTSAQRNRSVETSTAMLEMSATVTEVAKNAGSASESAREARDKARQGEESVRRVMEAISNVQSEAEALSESMLDLGSQSEAIGRVMEVISDIADQTNLLALNAAIEAARAGDAGRGFAVVADEVRKLAEKTMTATKEVGQVVQGIQSGSKTSQGRVERAVRGVAQVTDMAKESEATLSEIVAKAEVANDNVRAIAAAAEEQSAASEQITRSVEEVSRLSGSIDQAMSRSEEVISGLLGQIQELGAIIEQMSKRS